MKKTLLSVTAFIICLSLILCTFAGCVKKVDEKDEKEETTEKTETTVADTTEAESEEETTAEDKIYPDGIEVSEYLMIYLAETYNIELKISNSTENEIKVDFSKLTLKLNDERTLEESFSVVKVGAGKNITCTMPIEGDTSDFTKDSFFTVFYDGKPVGRAPMEYFE